MEKNLNFQKELMKKFNLPESAFSGYQSTMWINPPEHVFLALMDYLYETGNCVSTFISNVKGQKWYGKTCIEVKFGYL